MNQRVCLLALHELLDQLNIVDLGLQDYFNDEIRKDYFNLVTSIEKYQARYLSLGLKMK